MDGLARKSIAGMAWTASGRVAVRGVQFIVGIFLARLLTPADFGLVGMLGVFIGVSEMFVDCGFPLAFVRKVDRTDADAATVFWFSVAMAILCYAALFAAAPAIALFFEEPRLTAITRVVTTGILFGALASVPRALLSIRLKFRTLSAISMLAVAVSGSLGIYLAFRGFGVWSLVWQGVLGGTVGLALTALAARWRPRFIFFSASFREFFAFGWKHLASSLVPSLESRAADVAHRLERLSDALGAALSAQSGCRAPIEALQEKLRRAGQRLHFDEID